jgi:hypothetical protein
MHMRGSFVPYPECARLTVHESIVFNALGLALSEKQTP